MDLSLIDNFIRFPTMKAIWDNIATTYFDGTNTSRVYSLKRQYNNLQGLWREIDFHRPNLMKCEEDTQKYNYCIREDRVYIFLDGLDDCLDKIRADVLQLMLFPIVEQIFTHVCREDLRQVVMMIKEDTIPGAIMLKKGGQKPLQHSSLQMLGEKQNMTKRKSQVARGSCTHYGNMKHTRETCFKLYGYLKWWHELKRKKKHDIGTSEKPSQAALMSTKPQLSFIPHGDFATYINEPITSTDSGNTSHTLSYSNQENHYGWIIDSGATNHMTFDPQDFFKTKKPKRTCIANANRITYLVSGAGAVALSPSFSLLNTLSVPSLISKLLSVSQATEESNCCALMYVCFRIFSPRRLN
ncbi:hypothetical protein Pint_13771 [Pistacia integerrima]|uniref:Uncharacterized protein n=1 Tax=Pistacia integerrima TaxID=434235 RepID=A0ACC0YAW1_9ROSI|nr:hypothetical protein Pint_13771 [Pistacia integerrima]